VTLPAALYSDHGSDFTSDHTAQVCADVKVQLIHSTPGKPCGRGKIERLFGTITTELLPTLPGHIPPGNHGKPMTPPALSLSHWTPRSVGSSWGSTTTGSTRSVVTHDKWFCHTFRDAGRGCPEVRGPAAA